MSALNAVVLASSLVAFAMGRERHLPASFGRLHHRSGTPFRAVLVSGLVMLVSVAVLPIEQVGNLSSLFFLLSFVLVNASVVRLRRERPNMTRGFEVPLYPLPPLLGVVLNLAIGLYFLAVDPWTWAIAVAWLAVGGVAYLVVQRRRDRT